MDPDKKSILDAINKFRRIMTTPSSRLNKYAGFDIPDRVSKASLLGHLTKSIVSQKSRDDLEELGYLGSDAAEYSIEDLTLAARGGASFDPGFNKSSREDFLTKGLAMGVIKDTTGVESGFQRLLANPARADSAFYEGQTLARDINPHLPKIPQEVRNMALPHPSMSGSGARDPKTGIFDPNLVTYDPRPGVDKNALLQMLRRKKLKN